MPGTRPTVVTEEAKQDFAQTARHLFASTMYPFQSLQMMLLVWQRGEQADQELSDSSDEDGEVEGQDGDTTNPTVRYSTQKAYESRIEKIDNHNAWLGIKLLFERLPALEVWLKEEYNDKFVTKMGNEATKQRGTHTNGVKGDILGYLQPSSTESLGYPTPLNLPKEERGLQHHSTARFLIPRRCLEEFEGDPASVIARFCDDEDHSHSLIAEEWPTFLYDEHAGWNENDVRRGLFRGHVLVRVALRIFRNKTAAHADKVNKPYNPKSKAKGPMDVLGRCNIMEVTPRMIAYAAVQTYIGLSSIPMWGEAHGTFNLIHFYHLIVKTLSDDNEWAVQTIAWWKSKILGNGPLGADGTTQKRIRITTNTAYKLMMKQGQQEGHTDQLEYTYPKWTHRGALTSSSSRPNITTAGEEIPGDCEDDGPGEQSPNKHGGDGEHLQNGGDGQGNRQANTVSCPMGGTGPGDTTSTQPTQASNPENATDSADSSTPPATSQPHTLAQTHPSQSPQSSSPSPPTTCSQPIEKRSHPAADEGAKEADDTEPGSTGSSKRPRLAGADGEADASESATTTAPAPKRGGKGARGRGRGKQAPAKPTTRTTRASAVQGQGTEV